MPSIQLKPRHDRRVKQGHLWIFSNEIKGPLRDYPPGTIVDIIDARGRFLAKGYLNPHSLIAARILSWEKEETIDEEFFLKRIWAAWEYRQKIYPGREALRVVYSEGDLLPGLIVDKYNRCLVVQFHTWGMESMKDMVLNALEEVFKPTTIVMRNDVPVRRLEGLPLEKGLERGELREPLVIREDGLQFQVDVLEGQKSGFFFDQYENRLAMRRYIKAGQVLDCFCYTGAWALHAASAGAELVIGLDCSAKALDLARINAQLNGLTERCRFYRTDIFEGIEDLVGDGIRFDLVILDPPALAESRKTLVTALKGYEKINYQALKLLKTGGLLITSSCSYHVRLEQFQETVLRAAKKAGRALRLLRYGHQAPDHPVLISVPETQYLKTLFLSVN